MRIELTAQTIEEYGIAELTGNSKEDLLRAVAEAELAGQILWFKIPDAASSVQRMNVFERFGTNQSVDPADLEHGTNPIEQWDGKEIPSDVPVEVHVCDLPTIVVHGDEWTCPFCRTKYYADDTHREWVPMAELE